jgi:hypothetical protein
MYLDNPMGYEFHPHFMSDEGPLTILELGSGMGIVASKIADKFAQVGRDLVVATDLPEVCPLLEINLRRHLSHSRSDGVVLVRPLAWGDFTHALRIASELSSLDRPHALTHIVCSDLVSISHNVNVAHRSTPAIIGLLSGTPCSASSNSHPGILATSHIVLSRRFSNCYHIIQDP